MPNAKVNKAPIIILGIVIIIFCVLTAFFFNMDIAGLIMAYLFFYMWIVAFIIANTYVLFTEKMNFNPKRVLVLVSIGFLFIPLLLDCSYWFGKNSDPVGNKTTNEGGSKTIYIDGEEVYNNHVGNDWSFWVVINGTRYQSNDIINVNSDQNLSIKAYAEESDSYPDIGSNTQSTSASYLLHGGTVTIPVTVREDRGRYAGNTAQWNVEVSFKSKQAVRTNQRTESNYWNVVGQVFSNNSGLMVTLILIFLITYIIIISKAAAIYRKNKLLKLATTESAVVVAQSTNSSMESVNAKPSTTYHPSYGLRCPRCSSPMVLRHGKYGKFYGCSRYPSCRGTRQYK